MASALPLTYNLSNELADGYRSEKLESAEKTEKTNLLVCQLSARRALQWLSIPPQSFSFASLLPIATGHRPILEANLLGILAHRFSIPPGRFDERRRGMLKVETGGTHGAHDLQPVD